MTEYERLYKLKPRTQTGNISFTSLTSGATYLTATYGSGAYANTGEQGMLNVLKDVLSTYILVATDINTKADIGLGTVLPATAGTMTATMDGAIKNITPTGACTFNATGGAVGQNCSFVITTSGTNSYILTFGSNFKSTGTLTTGTVSAKVFTVSFIYNGTNWNETSRTVAM